MIPLSRSARCQSGGFVETGCSKTIKSQKPAGTDSQFLDPNARRYKCLGNPGDLFDWKNAILLLVCNDVVDEFLRNALFIVGKAVN